MNQFDQLHDIIVTTLEDLQKEKREDDMSDGGSWSRVKGTSTKIEILEELLEKANVIKEAGS